MGMTGQPEIHSARSGPRVGFNSSANSPRGDLSSRDEPRVRSSAALSDTGVGGGHHSRGDTSSSSGSGRLSQSLGGGGGTSSAAAGSAGSTWLREDATSSSQQQRDPDEKWSSLRHAPSGHHPVKGPAAASTAASTSPRTSIPVPPIRWTGIGITSGSTSTGSSHTDSTISGGATTATASPRTSQTGSFPHPRLGLPPLAHGVGLAQLSFSSGPPCAAAVSSLASAATGAGAEQNSITGTSFLIKSPHLSSVPSAGDASSSAKLDDEQSYTPRQAAAAPSPPTSARGLLSGGGAGGPSVFNFAGVATILPQYAGSGAGSPASGSPASAGSHTGAFSSSSHGGSHGGAYGASHGHISSSSSGGHTGAGSSPATSSPSRRPGGIAMPPLRVGGLTGGTVATTHLSSAAVAPTSHEDGASSLANGGGGEVGSNGAYTGTTTGGVIAGSSASSPRSARHSNNNNNNSNNMGGRSARGDRSVHDALPSKGATSATAHYSRSPQLHPKGGGGITSPPGLPLPGSAADASPSFSGSGSAPTSAGPAVYASGSQSARRWSPYTSGGHGGAASSSNNNGSARDHHHDVSSTVLHDAAHEQQRCALGPDRSGFAGFGRRRTLVGALGSPPPQSSATTASAASTVVSATHAAPTTTMLNGTSPAGTPLGSSRSPALSMSDGSDY